MASTIPVHPGGANAAVHGRSSELRKGIRRLLHNRSAVVGLVIILLMLLAAGLAGLLSPFSPLEMHRGAELLAPGGIYPLGTDEFGRDVLSRILYGARISLEVGLIAVGLATVVGTLLGLLAGYYGRWVDTVIMRCMDVVMAFPSVILAIAIMAVLGPKLANVMIALGIVYTPRFARITRGAVLSIKNEDYVVAARAMGNVDWRIMRVHMLPNILSPLIIQISLSLAGAILAESGLSFLGLGTQPPQPSWGSMLTSGREYMSRAWWYAAFPGMAIFLAVLGFNLFGDGLRDLLDPRLKR